MLKRGMRCKYMKLTKNKNNKLTRKLISFASSQFWTEMPLAQT